MSKDILLAVNNLTTEFSIAESSKKAVDNISFTLRRGETIGIVGESGSGKSITSLSAIKLIPGNSGKITSGEINYSDENNTAVNFVNLNEKEMQKYRGNDIAMIFQEPMTAMNPVMKCGEQVTEAILLHQKNLTNQKMFSIIAEKVFLLLLNLIKPVFYYFLLLILFLLLFFAVVVFFFFLLLVFVFVFVVVVFVFFFLSRLFFLCCFIFL